MPAGKDAIGRPTHRTPFRVPGVTLAIIPSEVHCPVCGEKMQVVELSQAEAQVSLSIRAARVLCKACGAGGVLGLKRSREGFTFYDLTFAIYRDTLEERNVLSRTETKGWTKRR